MAKKKTRDAESESVEESVRNQTLRGITAYDDREFWEQIRKFSEAEAHGEFPDWDSPYLGSVESVVNLSEIVNTISSNTLPSMSKEGVEQALKDLAQTPTAKKERAYFGVRNAMITPKVPLKVVAGLVWGSTLQPSVLCIFEDGKCIGIFRFTGDHVTQTESMRTCCAVHDVQGIYCETNTSGEVNIEWLKSQRFPMVAVGLSPQRLHEAESHLRAQISQGLLIPKDAQFDREMGDITLGSTLLAVILAFYGVEQQKPYNLGPGWQPKYPLMP